MSISAHESSSKKGLPEGFATATVIVKESLWDKLKDCSYWERKSLKEAFEEMLESYLQDKNRKSSNN